MAKVKKSFFCQNCGAQSAQWLGQCKSCNEWNTIVEEIVSKPKEQAWQEQTSSKINKPKKI